MSHLLDVSAARVERAVLGAQEPDLSDRAARAAVGVTSTRQRLARAVIALAGIAIADPTLASAESVERAGAWTGHEVTSPARATLTTSVSQPE